jgi:hypothetical protein
MAAGQVADDRRDGQLRRRAVVAGAHASPFRTKIYRTEF